MEALTPQLSPLGKEIEKVIINLKKSSLERGTTEFLRRTLSRLEELWRKFDEGDTSIHRLNPPIDLAYLDTNYHGPDH